MTERQKKIKLIRTSTIPGSIETFCRGLLRELQEGENYEVVVVSSPGKEMEIISQREHVKCIDVPMERHISPFRDIRSLLRLYKVFKKERPDMVHSITPKAGLLSMIAAKLARVPVRLHTFTGLVFPTARGFTKKILILTDKITCACATHIVPEGEGVKSDLQTYKITKKPLKILGHGNIRGIDLEYYNPTLPEVASEAEKIRDKDKFTFIFIGRIVGDKGINELIDAFEQLKKNVSDIRLILVGNFEKSLDPISEKSSEIIKEDKDIILAGPQKDVRPWLLASDAFVFPSYREGFPNVVIEAGAMGLPSIVTDINGSREIIINGENGLIIPPHDVKSLFETMKQMVVNKKERLKMASKSRNMIASRYEQSYVRQCLKDYYKEILNETLS